jgi:pSer/pThr/pTyr-binding forkhead associated (FHA) protein
MGHHEGKPAIPLMRPVTIVGSRQNAHLHLLSRQISKAHALLISFDGKVYIRDLASRTHVFINGMQVREADLVDGDELKLGSFVFKYQAASGMKQRPRIDETPEAQLGVQGEPYPMAIDQRVLLVGRRPICDVPLMEDSCSTAHAVIFAMGGKRYVRDLGSRTGTFVNGQTVRQQELQFGDTIKIGETNLEYQAVVSTDSAAEAAAEGADEFEDLVGTAPLVGSGLDFEHGEAISPVDEQRAPLAVEQGELLPAGEMSGKTAGQDSLHVSEADLDLDGDLELGVEVPAPIDTIGIPVMEDARARSPLSPGGISLAPAEPPQDLIAVETDENEIQTDAGIGKAVPAAADESAERTESREPLAVESRWAESERPLAIDAEEELKAVEPEAAAEAPTEEEAIPLSEDELLADMGAGPIEAEQARAVEESPFEEAPIEELPEEESVVAEAAVEEEAVAETPVAEAPAEETPIGEMAVGEVVAVEGADEESAVAEEAVAELPGVEPAGAASTVSETPAEPVLDAQVPEAPSRKRGWFGWGKRRDGETPITAAAKNAEPVESGEPELLGEPVDLPAMEEEATAISESSAGTAEVTSEGSLDFGDGPEASLSSAPASEDPLELTYDEEFADLTDLYPPEPPMGTEIPAAERPLEDINESERMVDTFNLESEPAREALDHEPEVNGEVKSIEEGEARAESSYGAPTDDDLDWDLAEAADEARAETLVGERIAEVEVSPQPTAEIQADAPVNETASERTMEIAGDGLVHEQEVVTSSTHEAGDGERGEVVAEAVHAWDIDATPDVIDEAHEQSGQPESLVPTEEIPAIEAAGFGVENASISPEESLEDVSREGAAVSMNSDIGSLDDLISDSAPLEVERLESAMLEPAMGETVSDSIEVVDATEPTSESAFPLEIEEGADGEIRADEGNDHPLTTAELALSDSTFGHQVEDFIGERTENPIVIVDEAKAETATEALTVEEEPEIDQSGSVEISTAPDLRGELEVESTVSEGIAPPVESDNLVVETAVEPTTVELTTADLVYEEQVDFGETVEAPPSTMAVEFEADAWLGDSVASAAALVESVEEFIPVSDVPEPAPSIGIEAESEPLAGYPEITEEPSLPEFDDLDLVAHAAPSAPMELPPVGDVAGADEGAAITEAMPPLHLPGMSLFDDSGAMPQFVSGMPLQLRELPPPPPTFGRVAVSFASDEVVEPLLDDPREPGPFEQLAIDLDAPLGVTQSTIDLADDPDDILTAETAHPVEIEEGEAPTQEEPVGEIPADDELPAVDELPAMEVSAPPEKIAEEPPMAEIAPPVAPARVPFQNKLRVPPPPRRGRGLKAPGAQGQSDASPEAPAGFGEASEVFGGLAAPIAPVDVFSQGLSADLSNDPFLGGAVRQPPAEASDVLTNGNRKLRDSRRKPRAPLPDDSTVAAMAGELADNLGAPPVVPRSTMRSAPAGLPRDRAASRFRNIPQGASGTLPASRVAMVEPPKVVPARRGRRVGLLFVVMLALMIASFVAIFLLMKQHIAMSASMTFENYTRLNREEQQRVQEQQTGRISSAELRDLAKHLKPKTVSDGFLGDPVEFGKNVSRINWSDNGVLTFKFDGTERADIDRVRAVMKALYVMDQDLVDSAGRTQNTLRTLQATIDQKRTLLERLKERRDIAVHRIDQPPSPEQIKTMGAEKAVAEKEWKEAWAKRYGAEVELKKLEQATSLSQSAPSEGSSGADKSAAANDVTLQEMQKSLDALNDRLATARNTASEQAESARKALDSALEQFQQSTNVVQGLIKDNPELAKFVSAVQRLQETTQKLSGDLLDRQQKNYEHLLEEKRYLDDRLSARRKELWDADRDIQRLKKDVAMRERGRGAAVAYEYADKAAELQKQMDEQLGKIEQRKMELESDPILATLNEFSTKRQQEIDASQSLLAADRKKAEALTKEMEKNLGQLLPTVEKLPDSQKALAQQMSSKMEIVANARKVYAEALESKNVEANSSLRLLEAAVRDKLQKVEDRKKTLASVGSQQMSAAEQNERQRTLDAKRGEFEKLTKAETAAYDSYIEKERATRVASTDVGFAAKLREEATVATDDYFHLRDSELPQLESQLNQTERLAGVFAYPLEPKVQEPAAMADQRMIYGLGSCAAIALVFSVLFAVTGGKHLPSDHSAELVYATHGGSENEPELEEHPGSPDEHWEENSADHEAHSAEESTTA